MDTMTWAQQELERHIRLSEAGTEPDCPFCRQPRVLRNDYIRCNLCGLNWLAEEMHLPDYLLLEPRLARVRMANSTLRTARQLEEAAKKVDA